MVFLPARSARFVRKTGLRVRMRLGRLRDLHMQHQLTQDSNNYSLDRSKRSSCCSGRETVTRTYHGISLCAANNRLRYYITVYYSVCNVSC